MKTNTLLYLTLMMLIPFTGNTQMKDPHEWVGYENVMGVKNGLRHYDYDIKLIYSSAPANVFWPDDNVKFTFQLSSNIDQVIQAEGKAHIIHYGSQGIPNDIWQPEMIKINEIKEIPVSVNISPNGYMNIDLEPQIPNHFGGYAVVFDLGKFGRRLATSFVRSMKPTPVRMQYPKQSLDDLGVDFLSRVGVQAIRYGVPYCPTTFRDYQPEMRKLDAEMKKYNDNNITVLLMFGEGQSLTPLGTPRSFLDENDTYKRTKQDYAWLPELDTDFRQYVKEICLKHGWPNGPVTAVSLWNEPWEGISISGWQADMLRYREIYKAMAQGVMDARKEGVDVLVGGCDSNSNAWDKLFSDGTMDMLSIFDFLSIHYQGMDSPVLYPQWNNRKDHKGRVLIWDTESWVGNTDDRIGLVVATNRSAGYDRSMGIYGGYMYSRGHFRENDFQQVRTQHGVEEVPSLHHSWSPAAAMGAVQGLIGERDFKELLFKNGLPWIMVFDGYNNNADDGTVLITGDLGEAFGAENILFRNVRSQHEVQEKIHIRQQINALPENAPERARLKKELDSYKAMEIGSLTLKADLSFVLYDFYGNVVKPVNGLYNIPLNYKGYYMRTNGTKGSFNRLLNTLKKAGINGYEPLDIVAKDMTVPVAEKPEMELILTNILNRPVSGNLKVSLGDLSLNYPSRVSLKAHETKTIRLQINAGEATVDNNYPLEVTYDAGKDGLAVHWEDMHVNYIPRKKITIDGKLDEWADAIPQIVKGSSDAAISLTEAAWYPFRNFDTKAEGLATAYMAYDDEYFYFAAKVADATPNDGTYRFEKRNDDEFFYPETAYMQTILAMHASEVTGTTRNDNEEALQHPGNDTRIMNYLENTETTQSIGLDLDLPLNAFTRTALYFPNVDQRNLQVVVYDRENGKELFTQNIPAVWNGAYLVLNLSGNVRIRCTAEGWWYTVKLAGMFFDESEANVTGKPAASYLYKDFDTQGNWKNVYGKKGYYLAGLTPNLPESIAVMTVKTDDRIELVWPEGVRRFTYRKDPVIPDASMGKPMDNIMIAFNVIPIGQDGMESNPKGTMPRYTGYKCTDYEYALNTVAPEYGGGFEIWRMLVPGMTRKHFYPRQPVSADDGPVKGGKLITRREGNTIYTECAIPWGEIPDVRKALDKGDKIKFSYRVNDDGAGGACMELARKRSVSKINARAFHPDWKEHWANEVEFGFGK